MRIAQTVPVVIGITIVSFVLIHLVPGDPARAQLGVQAPESSVNQLRHEYGLDKPLPAAYLDFLAGAATLDLGESLPLGESVGDLIARRVRPTLLLTCYACFVALSIAIPLALYSAIRRDQAPDQLVRAGGMIFFAMPPFWLALLLVLVFSLNLGWLPSSGYGNSPGEMVRFLTLPALTLGLAFAPLLVRSLRASILETLEAGFVEAARARGFTERRILLRQVLRPSLSPMLTVLGFYTGGFLISSAVIVEAVFGIPGLGRLLVDSVGARDYPLVQGLTLTFGVLVVVINLVTDLLYAAVDPRVRL